MKYLVRTADARNPAADRPAALLNGFDGMSANDGRTTRLLAALASVAGDHTQDKLARQMIRNATADLFDAAARLDRIGRCGNAPRQLESASLLEGAHA